MPWVKPNKIDVKHQNLNELDRFWHQKCWIEPFKNRTLWAQTLNCGGSNQNCRFHKPNDVNRFFYTWELETPRQKKRGVDTTRCFVWCNQQNLACNQQQSCCKSGVQHGGLTNRSSHINAQMGDFLKWDKIWQNSDVTQQPFTTLKKCGEWLNLCSQSDNLLCEVGQRTIVTEYVQNIGTS
jgi:hypothetical protein